MSIEEQLKKLEVRDGDILRVPEHSNHESIELLAKLLQPRRVTIFCGDIDLIDEAAMNAAGWYRK